VYGPLPLPLQPNRIRESAVRFNTVIKWTSGPLQAVHVLLCHLRVVTVQTEELTVRWLW